MVAALTAPHTLQLIVWLTVALLAASLAFTGASGIVDSKPLVTTAGLAADEHSMAAWCVGK